MSSLHRGRRVPVRYALGTAFAAAALSVSAAAPALAQEQTPTPAHTSFVAPSPARASITAGAVRYPLVVSAANGQETAAITEPLDHRSSRDLRVGMALIFAAIAAGSVAVIVSRRRRDTRDEPTS